MKKILFTFALLLVLSFSGFAQKGFSKLKSIKLFAPTDVQGQVNNANADQMCFSFISEKISCDSNSDIYYGTIRRGEEWDWFQVMGAGSQNKIASLGKKNWKDKLQIPVVEPYAKLKDGEQRQINIDLSGKDGEIGINGKRGERGLPGVNTDGTVTSPKKDPEESIENPQNKVIEKTNKNSENDYNPYEKAVEGNMYVVRVVDKTRDFYVLFRVEKLERGKSCKISWKKIDSRKMKNNS